MTGGGVMIGPVAAFRFRVFRGEGSGLSRLGGSQASANFITKNTKNRRDPGGKARMALRATRITPAFDQDDVAARPARGQVSFLRGSPWFSVFSVTISFLLVLLTARGNGTATVGGEQYS
jgi:hypothetical protein